MQKLGQHFLKNATILQKIADAVAPANGERIIEIGPGHGELTAPLALAARGKHCEIICIEKDRALIEGLEMLAAQERAESGGPHIRVVEGDALKLIQNIAAEIGEEKTPKQKNYKITGNIPYYITGKLLRTVSELENKPERVVLLIQKEVAERICAVPPRMNRLAASVQFWAAPAIIASVPRTDFSPAPEVDSAVIVLDTLAEQPAIDPAHYYRAVRAIFAQPRKMLINNLSSAGADRNAKSVIAAHLEKMGIDPALRPQNMSTDDIIAIAKVLQ
jgi:16S rRNA (adenine1518-N6/adenine1519-N6)-dimethyltransferase